MLVLTRGQGQEILIGDDVSLVITKIRGGSVRIGIQAPKDVKILRGEVAKQILPEPEETTLLTTHPIQQTQNPEAIND